MVFIVWRLVLLGSINYSVVPFHTRGDPFQAQSTVPLRLGNLHTPGLHRSRESPRLRLDGVEVGELVQPHQGDLRIPKSQAVLGDGWMEHTWSRSVSTSEKG